MRFAPLKLHQVPAAATTVAIMLLAACGEGATNPAQPNRPPVVVGELPAEVLAAHGSANIDASAYFSDPDGDVLTYSAFALDSSFVKVYVSGPEVSLFGKNRGWPWTNATSITITATDPDGLSAAQDMSVTVEAGDVGFRDDFDAPTSSNWRLTNAVAEVDDGALLLTSLSGSVAMAVRRLNAGMLDWEVNTRLALTRDSMTVRIVARTSEPIIQAVALDIGPGVLVDGNATNYRMLFLHREGGWAVLGAGNYAAFDKAGDVLEVGFFLKNGRIGLAVDGQSIRTEPTTDFGLTGVELWVVPLNASTDRQAFFEWVEVAGAVP